MGAPAISLTAFEDRLFTSLTEARDRDELRAIGLPSKRTEAWKWTDLRAALREDRTPSDAFAGEALALPDGFVPDVTYTFRNGRLDAVSGTDGLQADARQGGEGFMPDWEVPSAKGHELAVLADIAPCLHLQASGEGPKTILVRHL